MPPPRSARAGRPARAARPDAPARRRAADRPTADVVLDVAERLAQTRGFNGFSYADVAAEIGITTASLHYHFATKADLGRALIDRYTEGFGRALEAIDASAAPADARLERYARLYVDVLSAGRMCLCGMLAAEFATLAAPMQRALRTFFDRNEAWLAGTLERGRAAGELRFSGAARDAAAEWASTLEGAMLLARSYRDPARLSTAARRLVSGYAAR
jgi:TetR/AcrR family transcriptional repressor of nem operon